MWTCDCEGTFYELRQAGGLQFIRWTRVDERGAQMIEDSHTWRAAIAAAHWQALLRGELR
ncbi:hypothetical protein AB0I81_53065 [Nonomuraea sp. NPDC050404]|uniref:hypothetical protein n=1 Tax=Nonomuraea sp. NPDC050404 TaxID=3155783 RepID=UPI0033C374F0